MFILPLDGVSLVGTFDRAGTVDPHRVQYFEIGGTRAIYRDGWMASVFPYPRDNFRAHDFNRDRWELYHVAEDFSQAHDVAARHPQKLKELQALFDTEAQRNHVYPLGAGTLIRAPEWSEGKRRYVFYPGFPTLFRFPGSPTAPGYEVWDFSQPHRITAEADIPPSGASGTILSWGSRYGGVALYARDNRLVYENNVRGKIREVLTSSEALPTGRVELVFELAGDDSQAWPGAIGRLYINGRQVSTKKLSPNASHFFDGVFEIGQNSVSPVSNTYEPPFRFSGVLRKVTVEIGREK